jgi:hypothetical protein
MTGDVKIPSKEELLNAAEGEQQTEQTQETQEPQYTETELKALEQGWKPKDKWEGNPEDHRSAREYLDRGELLGKIKSQNTQLSEIRDALRGMSEHNRKVYAAGYENALRELKQQKLAALRDGEPEQVLAIDDKIDETKDAIRAIKAQPPAVQGPSPVTKSWLEDNSWYGNDMVLTHYANGVATEVGRSGPNVTEQMVYDAIDKAVRKEFPEKFGARKQTVGALSPDGEGRKAAGAGKPTSNANNSFEKILSGMSEMEASIARNLVKTGGLTKEKYVEDYMRIRGG